MDTPADIPEPREPYRLLFHLNMLIGFFAGTYVGYRLTMVVIHHNRLEGPVAGRNWLWVPALIGLVLFMSFFGILVSNAGMAAALFLLRKVTGKEASGMAFRLATPPSLLKPSAR